MFDAPPQEGNPPATPFSPSTGTGGTRGGDAFGVKNDVFGEGVGGPAGAAPFGSPPGGVFGGDGGGEDHSSAWWESEAGNDDTDQPDSRVESKNLTSGTAMGENKGDSSVVNALKRFQGMPAESPQASSSGTHEEMPTRRGPQQGTARPACASAEASTEDLGAPPAAMFGPPPPPAHAETELAAQPQAVTPPLGQPPRAQAPPSTAADGSVAPVPFSSRPPYGVKVDVGDAIGVGVGSTAGIDADPSGSGVDAWTDRTASPGWEKQPSPPLDLGVFGAPPGESVTAIRGAADLFGAASEGAAAGESAEGEGEHGGWGMCSTDPEGAPESDMAKGTADTDCSKAAPPVSAASTRHQSESLEKLAHLSNPPRSSFVANDGTATASVAALALEVAPSLPPRLFASRSSSWAEKDTTSTGEGENDYEGMFAGKEREGSGGLPPQEGSTEQRSSASEDKNETANLAAVGPTSSLTMGEVPALLPKTEPAQASSPRPNLPPLGSNPNSEKYSQGAQPPFSTIPEALDASQSPPRLRERPPQDRPDEAPAVELTSSSSHACDGGAGPTAATPESGGRLGPGSTLSTPFGALSRGSGTTPRTAEGFPSSEDGGIFDGPLAEGSMSEGKDAPDCAGSSGRSRASGAPPASAVVPSVFAEGDDGDGGSAAVAAPGGAAIEEANDGEGAGAGVVSTPEVVERKEDGQPRWAAPPAAAADPPPPSAAGEAARKMDTDNTLDGGDGWSDDDWGVDDDADAGGEVCDLVGDKGSKEEAAGTAVVAGDGLPDAAVDSGGQSETSLFGSEVSDGDESWGRGQEEDGSGRAEEEAEEESCSESESGLDSFSDNDLSNEASIAETTASDFFAVRQRKLANTRLLRMSPYEMPPRHILRTQETRLSCET